MVKVESKILEQINKVRESGRVNMFARREVQVVANDLECYSLVCYIEDYPEEYLDGVVGGFEEL